MRDEAEKRIGHLYPQVEITSELVLERPDLMPYEGRKLNVIAWLWARTVKSPNPAFADVDVPLASTFMLSTKKGHEAYVEPVFEEGGYRFTVKSGTPANLAAAKAGTKVSRGANFRCVVSGTPLTGDYIKAEGKAGRMGARLMAIVVEGDRSRVYLSPIGEHELATNMAKPKWAPRDPLPDDPRAIWCPLYGLTTFAHLFTSRQLVALTTFSDLVGDAVERIRRDAAAAGLPDDGRPLQDGGTGATAYAEAVGVYLAFATDKVADYWSSISTWHVSRELIRNTFGRQAIPMTWDYAETNPFSSSAGNWMSMVDWIWKYIAVSPATRPALCTQADASAQTQSVDKVVSTDPPYYDNIGYADLSDFFYVWLRRALKPVFPDLFATVAVPKAEELVATPYRHGSKASAESFFLGGMTSALRQLCEQAHPEFPVTIYYAFKQAERKGDTGVSSTGWETFLDAVIRSGFSISGTWPMRTELGNRMIGMGTNALASSIVLVCRRRASGAPVGTRSDFLTALKSELPHAVRLLQTGNIAPVDLAQAAIGPGMAVYTRYAKVLNIEGNAITVREALAMINQILDEVLAEQEGDFDPDSRWALAWFDQFGFSEGEFGIAEILSKAKNTSVQGMVEAGIIESQAGTVRLFKPNQLPSDWDPGRDTRLTTWEAVHHLIRVLEDGGEEAAGALAAELGPLAEVSRELCYRLYTVCERKKRTEEARAYNGLVQSWPEIMRLSRVEKAPVQQSFDDME
jgi:putative DNA methylase